MQQLRLLFQQYALVEFDVFIVGLNIAFLRVAIELATVCILITSLLLDV